MVVAFVGRGGGGEKVTSTSPRKNAAAKAAWPEDEFASLPNLPSLANLATQPICQTVSSIEHHLVVPRPFNKTIQLAICLPPHDQHHVSSRQEQFSQLSTRISHILGRHSYFTLNCTLHELLLLHQLNAAGDLGFFSIHKENILILLVDGSLGLDYSIAVANSILFLKLDRQLYYKLGLEGTCLDKEKSKFLVQVDLARILTNQKYCQRVHSCLQSTFPSILTFGLSIYSSDPTLSKSFIQIVTAARISCQQPPKSSSIPVKFAEVPNVLVPPIGWDDHSSSTAEQHLDELEYLEWAGLLHNQCRDILHGAKQHSFVSTCTIHPDSMSCTAWLVSIDGCSLLSSRLVSHILRSAISTVPDGLFVFTVNGEPAAPITTKDFPNVLDEDASSLHGFTLLLSTQYNRYLCFEVLNKIF